MKPSLVIVGLGNPGKEYEGTRHNTGYRAIEKLAEEFGTNSWQPKQKFVADMCEGRIITMPILMVKPVTYMNRSGESIRKILDFYQLDPSRGLLVIADDIDLSVGDLRLRKQGGPGTHNGLKSIVEQVGEDFPRIRIGVGKQKEGEDLANYVLSRSSANETTQIDDVIKTIPEMIRTFVLGKD